MSADIRTYRAQIEAAMRHGSEDAFTFDDIVAGVERGDFQFWPGERSVLITQIVEYPRAKVFFIFLAGGDLAEIERMSPPIEAWGKAHGCTRMMLMGRPGWTRSYLAHNGWTTRKTVVMEKVI